MINPLPDPAPGETALLLIDMVNALDFEGGDDLRAATEDIVAPILSLRAAADAAGVPVIYVNDNNGQWHSERTRLVEETLANDTPGRAVTHALRPRDDDYFIIKPQFSGILRDQSAGAAAATGGEPADPDRRRRRHLRAVHRGGRAYAAI
ncbi:isochorismatase family protein [Sphingomonas sp. WKB10]|nr:isochorismatase family protein [Sphingomonas sp. WKB10]